MRTLAALMTACVCVVAGGSAVSGQTGQTGQTGQPSQPSQPSQPRPAPAAKPTVTISVTDMEGRPVPDLWVRASGPVDREAPTDAEGTVTFRNMGAGAYRLRFEREGYVTLERDIMMQPATRPVKVSVAMTSAPPPPAPPPPKPEPAPATPKLPPAGPPTSLSIPDFVEKNFVGSAPTLVSPIGCAPGGTANLLQLRDPLAEHTHADADEMLYVVAGEGTHQLGGKQVPLAAGVFAVVPRGTPHALARRGSRPLIVLSIMGGEPCSQ